MNYKYYTLLLLAGITCAAALAQPIIKRQKTLGGYKDDFFTYMVLTKDGGLLAGGYSYSDSSGEKTDDRRGSGFYSDMWVVKLDSTGQIEWDKTIGGNNGDVVQCMQQTTDGGYILGGYSFSNISGEKTENSRGLSDYWVVKLDSEGNIQWDKTLGGNNTEWLFTLQQTADEGFILSGHSYSGISCDKTEGNRGVNGDYWIVKLDKNGKKQWDKTIGGNNNDELPSITQTKDGGYLLGGSSYSNASSEKTENARGGYDYWIVKLDGAGNIQWDKTIGGTDYDVLYALQQTTDGGYVLGGTSGSGKSGEKSQKSRGTSDYWIVKLDEIGNIQWDKTIGGVSFDDFYSLQQTIDGGYILGGSSTSDISGEKTENSRGGYDYWMVKLNSRGNIQWDKTIGGSNDDGGSFTPVVREIRRNHYIVGGHSLSGISGDKTQKNRKDGGRPYHDYWIVTFNYRNRDSVAVTGLQEEGRSQGITDKSENVFSVYPNPAKNQITIQNKGTATFNLTNQQGKTVLTKVIVNTGTLNVSNVPAGIYFLTNTNTGITQNIVVTK